MMPRLGRRGRRDVIRTNGERLEASLREMARIGATAAGGVTRLALSDEDRAARDLFARWCADLGLELRVDDLGSQYARRPGRLPDAAPVLIGSHLDSVPAGGKFDGPLGVLSGLEVLRTLHDAGVSLARPIELVNFTNEEGARFEPAMVASGVLCGRYAPEFVYARRDRDGLAFGDELDRIGYRGSAANRPGAIHAYLELHIEQGPVLESEGLPFAVVEGILGVQWLDVTLRGQPQHAGPSPMRARRDPLVAAARIVVGVRELALAYPDPVVATVGRLRPDPGVINQIPGQVVMSVDVRHWTPAGLDEIAARAEALIRQVADDERVEAEIRLVQQLEPTIFDPTVVALVESVAADLGVPPRRLTAGAAHDAKFMSQLAPTAMLFVRTIGGKSHCESEAIDWPDARLAADVLLHSALRLAEQPG
jgi:beta-ureidopropionase / N-carbamoyl-L-amino-acid hydrolase